MVYSYEYRRWFHGAVDGRWVKSVSYFCAVWGQNVVWIYSYVSIMVLSAVVDLCASSCYAAV